SKLTNHPRCIKSQKRWRSYQFKTNRTRGRGNRSQFQSGEGQDLYRPHARFVSRGIPVPQTAHTIERNRLWRFLPRGNSGKQRSGSRHEILPRTVSRLSKSAVKRESPMDLAGRGLPKPERQLGRPDSESGGGRRRHPFSKQALNPCAAFKVVLFSG